MAAARGAAIGEPALDRPPGRAVARLAMALLATLLLVVLIQSLDAPQRASCWYALLLLMLTVGRQTAALQALLPRHPRRCSSSTATWSLGDRLPEHGLIACAIVFVATLLGKWVLWTPRPDAGRLAA